MRKKVATKPTQSGLCLNWVKNDWIRPALQGILIELPQFRCLQSHRKTNFEENKIAFPNSIIIKYLCC
jgi:hypothetical protein